MSYGDYILRTGSALAAWEDAFGCYLQESRFAGLDPILDVGPGRGWFLRQAPDRIRGLDLDADLVAYHAAHGLAVTQGSVTEIPFGDGEFEGVFCCWLLEHLREPDRALREIHRILRPGGYACVIVPSARTVSTTFYDDYTHVRPYTQTSLTQLAHDSGFRRIEINSLFWTRGAGRLAPRIDQRRLVRALRFLDTAGRRLGLVNRNNLVLEAWKSL